MSNLAQALHLVKLIEPVAAQHGCHVALTGGILYKEGERKDIDILFYRHKKEIPIQVVQFFKDLANPDIGLVVSGVFSRVCKASWGVHTVDLFPPEDLDGQYVEARNHVAGAALTKP